MSQTIEAIIKNNLIFISAQPDNIYFHWQVEIYLYQFSKHNILDYCYAIFGYTGDKPSYSVLELAKKYPKQIKFYKDERTPEETIYIPSIRPHILKKFFRDYPELGKNVFYHDSDIFLVKLPKFELLLTDDIAYLSDTNSYINYNYLETCSKRYKETHLELETNDLIKKMVSLFEISEELVKQNNNNSGGAQYLLKDIDFNFWVDVEKYSNKLYSLFKDYEKQYPIDHHIQSWATDMWCVLWCYWKLGKKALNHLELDFSWATSSSKDYYIKPIFHLAGITNELSKTHLYKFEYSNKNIIKEYAKNKQLFNYISSSNATYEYVKVIKEYVDNQNPETYKSSSITQFLLQSNEHYSDIYVKDEKSIYFKKPLWRSQNNKYIIFFNNIYWIITLSIYENEISKTCGGFLSGKNGNDPYDCTWNLPNISIQIL